MLDRGGCAMSRRVAVVDDDRDIRDGLKTALTDEGYDVTVVPNGLRLLSALQVDKPDLIVLDVMMSWIDGFELCRAMKRNGDYAKIPVLFISAKGSQEDIRHGLECGAVDYVTKPFDLPTLLHKIENIIGRP
jgi:DNA-binding response OmpR family regulator